MTQFSPERQKLMWSFAKKCSNAVYFSQHCLLFLLRKGNPDPELQNSRVYVCSSIYWQQNSGNIAKKIPYYPHRLTPDFCLLCYRIHSRFEFYTYFCYWEKGILTPNFRTVVFMSVVVFIGSKTRGTSPRKSRITPTDLRQIFAYYVIESIQDLNFPLTFSIEKR